MNSFETMPLRFRVWDKEERRFVSWDGNYCFARDENGDLYLCNIDWSSKDLPEEGNNRFIISQDTGLKDKNGKSIYTGDVLEWERRFLDQKNLYIRGVIVYKFAHICMEVKTTAGKKEYVPIWGILPDLKIISSIWQNPELLEEK